MRDCQSSNCRDASTDDTRGALLYAEGILLLAHERNRGKGAAIRTALSHATEDFIIIQDADLDYDPREYPKLLRPIGKVDMVYGNRFAGEKLIGCSSSGLWQGRCY